MPVNAASVLRTCFRIKHKWSHIAGCVNGTLEGAWLAHWTFLVHKNVVACPSSSLKGANSPESLPWRFLVVGSVRSKNTSRSWSYETTLGSYVTWTGWYVKYSLVATKENITTFFGRFSFFRRQVRTTLLPGTLLCGQSLRSRPRYSWDLASDQLQIGWMKMLQFAMDLMRMWLLAQCRCASSLLHLLLQFQFTNALVLQCLSRELV